MNLIKTMREEFKERGTMVYAWVLAELLNNEEAQKILTKTDKETAVRIIKKIEKQHR